MPKALRDVKISFFFGLEFMLLLKFDCFYHKYRNGGFALSPAKSLIALAKQIALVVSVKRMLINFSGDLVTFYVIKMFVTAKCPQRES